MMCFPCAACGAARTIATLHAWVYDVPFCSDECMQRDRASDRSRAIPSARDALAKAAATLEGSMRLAEQALDGRSSVASTASTADAASLAVRFMMGPFAGAIAKGVADDRVERAMGRQQDLVWTLEQQLLELTRRLMTLHGLGYPIAPQMGPLVHDFSSIASTGTAHEIVALHRYLARLRGGVGVWIDELAVPNG